MTVPDVTWSLGQLLEACVRDAHRAWCSDTARGVDPEVHLATALKGTDVSVSLYSSNGTYVWITVRGRRVSDTWQYGYRLLLQGRYVGAPQPHRVA